MRHFSTTAQFYRSQEWQDCKALVLHRELERNPDGVIRCAYCGQPILKGFNPTEKNNRGAIVFHHVIPLNTFNVNDASIAINPENIQVLHWRCHNEVHERFGVNQAQQRLERKVYLITGAPLSGKSTFAREHRQDGDLVLDIDDIWQAVSGCPRYQKPKSIKPIVFGLRDEIKVMVARGLGSWRNAFIIESLPNALERNKEAERYKSQNVEVLTMEATEAECLERLHRDPQGRSIEEYEKFIRDYFRRFTDE